MNVTSTGIATALAIVVVLGFFLFGISNPFTSVTDQGTAAPITTTMENPGELMTTDLTVGTGATAVPGTIVTVNYVGKLADGTIFDASARHGKPFTFQLGVGAVIAGWDQGVAGMNVGGKRVLVIPPELGYGAQGAGGVIPPNATLTFEVELLDVQSPN
jgi:FKBP-type peptidyl-prolyl cis-trans isomerase